MNKRNKNIVPTISPDLYKEHPSFQHHYKGHKRSKSGAISYWRSPAVLLAFSLAIGIIVLWSILATSNTAQQRYRPYLTPEERAKKEASCKTAEIYNATLDLCQPLLHIPSAFEPAILNNGIQACESFYENTCGTWIRQHTNQDLSFSFLAARNRHDINDIIDKALPGDPIRKLYDSCKNAFGYERETVMEQRHLLRVISDSIRSLADLPVAFARLSRYGFTAPFSFSIETHPRRPILVPMVLWDGFDSDLISNKTLIQELLLSIDRYASPEMRAWSVAARTEKLVTMLQDIGHTTRRGDIEQGYIEYVESSLFEKDMTVYSSLPKWTGYASAGNGWTQYLEELGGVNLQFNSMHPLWSPDFSYLSRLLGQVIPRYTKKDWQLYVDFSIAYNTHKFIPVLPNNAYFRSEMPILEHRIARASPTTSSSAECSRVVAYMLPGLVAQRFLQKDFSDGEHTRNRITLMVERLKTTFARMIRRTPWMNDQDKRDSVKKIQSITVRVMHPNVWHTEDFADRLGSDRWLYNLNLIRRYRVQRNLELWHRGADSLLNRDEIQRFGAPLSTVNAYYSPSTNTITVFAGILRPPFYHPDYNEVSVWARVGSVVAHELSHALDNTGRKFDLYGSLPYGGWWGEESVKGFEKQAQCIIDEYGPPQGCINAEYGRQTLGEDIADLVGLRMAYEALFDGNTTSTVQDKQLFFASFSQLWCASYTPEMTCKIVKSDVHAIPRFRVDKTLRQMPEFWEAYGCAPYTRMVHEDGKHCLMYG